MAAYTEPDVRFLEEVMTSSGGDLKKCYQCATCTTVCDLSDEATPFPRRQMAQAQWGMAESLAADRTLWLCHNCGSCTRQCPRGARPGDVMAALRQQAIRSLAVPRFMGAIVGTPRLLPLLFLVPALIFAAIALWAPKGAPTPRIEFANLFPILILEVVFWCVSALVLAAFAAQTIRFRKALAAAGETRILRGLVPAVIEILRNERLKDCEADRAWRAGHLAMVWGFCGLAVTGTLVGMGTMLGWLHTPLEPAHRLKILANLCSVFAVAGMFLLLWSRWRNPEKRRSSTYFDWFFLGVLCGVVFTGVLSQLLRLAQLAPAMFVVYFIHLVLIFALFLCAPYSKFAHSLYRVMAVASTEPWSPKRHPYRAEIDEEGEIPVYN